MSDFSPEEPAPGQLHTAWVFERWTGPRRKWLAYDERVQELLRADYNAGGDVRFATLGHAVVAISTAPGEFWQDNPRTDAPTRRVRLAPLQRQAAVSQSLQRWGLRVH